MLFGSVEDNFYNIVNSIIEINKDDEYKKEECRLLGFEYNPKPIKLYISSEGGSVHKGFGIVDVLRSSKTPVHTIALGECCSSGFTIFVCGKKGFVMKILFLCSIKCPFI